jgi:hypothetical protein
MGTTTVDPVALRAAGRCFDAAADIVLGVLVNHLGHLRFDGAAAGRSHAAAGDAVRAGLDLLAADLAGWVQSSQGIAAAVREGADRHAVAEGSAAAALR